MDVHRVEEILESPDKITVTYQGVPVWINAVDNLTQIANVHSEDYPAEEKKVPVSELTEVR